MTRWPQIVALALAMAITTPVQAQSQTQPQSQEPAGEEAAGDSYSKDEILAATQGLFGTATKGLADVIEKVFADLGRPNAYIAGGEYSGAIGVGLRYGEGTLSQPSGAKTKVFWQGPSVGFDLGGNASKVFVLVYNLKDANAIFGRVPGVEGSYYFVAGAGVNYQTDGEITLAPIRTGVGLRTGVNIGYLHYSPEFSWLPF